MQKRLAKLKAFTKRAIDSDGDSCENLFFAASISMYILDIKK